MLEKVVEILTVARKPALRGELISACSLSSLTFATYVTQLLLPCGLLDVYPAILLGMPGRRRRKNRHRIVYQTSNAGARFLKLYGELRKLLSPT